MTRATIEESSSAPAASGVPSFGESSHAPDAITRARAWDSPNAVNVRRDSSPTLVTLNHDEKASTRSMPSGSPDSNRWAGPTSSWSSLSSTTSAMIRSAPGRVSFPSASSRRKVRAVSYRWCPSATTTGEEPTALLTASMQAWSSITHSWWTTPSSSVAVIWAGPDMAEAKVSVSPEVSDSPQIGDRFIRVARNRSSRSLFGLGRVCSWGRMSPTLSSSMARAPMIPLVERPEGEVIR